MGKCGAKTIYVKLEFVAQTTNAPAWHIFRNESRSAII